jgi:phosphoglycerate dehydrogenase-like enzyme
MTNSTSPVTDRHQSAEYVIKTVGVIGLGHMGNAFATNLI